MPIEIRELIIKTTIEDGSKKAESPQYSMNIEALKERILEECIERTMELIERKSER